jgi:hypothetical protein
MKKISVILLVTVALFFSCRKEERQQYKCSGVWNMTRMEQTWYTAGVADSSITTGELGYLRLLDNASEWSDLDFGFDTTLTRYPRWTELLTYSDYVFWGLDNHSYDRFVFAAADAYQDYLTVYSVIKQKRNHLELQLTMAANDGNLRYREVLVLDRIKP